MNEAAARHPRCWTRNRSAGTSGALNQSVNGKPLIYLDNAASAQKPEAVLDAMDRYYRESHSNVHRVPTRWVTGPPWPSRARGETVRGFLNANSISEIVWVRGATEGINLIANGFYDRLGPVTRS